MKRRSISTGVKQTKNQNVAAGEIPVSLRAGNDEITATYSVTDSVGIYLLKPAKDIVFRGRLPHCAAIGDGIECKCIYTHCVFSIYSV